MLMELGRGEVTVVRVHVKEMKPNEWAGSCGDAQILLKGAGETSETGVVAGPFDLWMMSLAFAVAESIRAYVTEKAWNLESLHVDAVDERSGEGKLLYITFLIHADGLHQGERDELFGAVRNRCTLLRLINKEIEIYFSDQLANG